MGGRCPEFLSSKTAVRVWLCVSISKQNGKKRDDCASADHLHDNGKKINKYLLVPYCFLIRRSCPAFFESLLGTFCCRSLSLSTERRHRLLPLCSYGQQLNREIVEEIPTAKKAHKNCLCSLRQ